MTGGLNKKHRFIHAMLKKLVPAHPAAIFPKDSPDTKPLKVGIFEDLVAAHPEIDKPALSSFVREYTQKTRYHRAMVSCSHRVDLDGNPCQAVGEPHRERAKQVLAGREKQADARRVEREAANA